jgi:drug/metabolite transporter (DMT)-like permease
MPTLPLSGAIGAEYPTDGTPVQNARIARLVGPTCVVFTALGWGLNWPATKYLLAICPPLSARGVSGLIAGGFLFTIAASRGETLAVPRPLLGRVVTAALLNVSAWMGLTTASMLWLPAGEAATLAYTMPVWAALLAWPILGERPNLRQIWAIILGFSGVLVLVGDRRLSLEVTRLPGIVLALSAAILFALGTVRAKRVPIPLPRLTLTAWQVSLGCLPLLIGGRLTEHTDFANMPAIGWVAIAYTAVVSMGLCYLLWSAALRHLNASSAAIGTLLTPVIGVAASSLALGEMLTISQGVSLALVASGIILAFKN